MGLGTYGLNDDTGTNILTCSLLSLFIDLLAFGASIKVDIHTSIDKMLITYNTKA